MRLSAESFIFAVVASMMVLLPAPARADVRTEARRHFRAGMVLIQEGRTDEGIAELQAAYDILPHPNVLYNIGRAYAEAGRYEESLEFFERYLESDPPDREEVVQFIAAIQGRLSEAEGEAHEVASEAPPSTEPTHGGATDVDEDDLRAIEDAALQVEVLYETTGNPALQERAARLRALAASLRAGGTEGGAGRVEGEPGESGEPSEHPERDGLDTGALADDRAAFEEEVVSASRFAESPIDAPNSTTTITAQDLRLSGQLSLGEILRRAAGISVMSTTPNHTDVNIRGFNQRLSNKTLILINGRTIRLDFLATPFFQVIPFNIRDIERIEIIRGPAAAVYGFDAFSGVINIILRDPEQAESYVTAFAGNANSFGTATAVSGASGRLSYRFGGGYDQRGNFQRFAGSGRVDLSPTLANPDLAAVALRFHADVRAELGEDRDYRMQFGTAVSQGDNYAFQGIARFRELAANDIFFAQTHYQFNTPQGIQLRAYWNAFSAEVDTVEQIPDGLPTVGNFDSNVVDVELSFTRRFHLGVDHNLSMGAGYRFKQLDWDWGENTTENHYNAYIQDALTLHPRLRLTLSARVDKHPRLTSAVFSPRGALVARVTEGSSIRFTAGTAFRSPSFLESYLEFENRTGVRGVTALGRGNRHLNPERIISMEVGYTNQDTDYFALEANVYLNYVYDLIGLNQINAVPLSDTQYFEDVAAFPIGGTQFNNLPGRYRQLGGEIGLRVFPVDGLDVYANYALSDVTPLDQPPTELEVFFQDQRTSLHQLNVGFQFRSKIGLDLSADLHWVSSQTWAEQFDDPETGVRYQLSDVPAYALLNARVGWRFLDDQLEVSVSGWNLLFDDFRMHPFGQRVDTRFLGQVDVRF